MRIFEWLQENMIRLRDAEVDSPRRDCLVLLEDVLKKNRSWVLSHPENTLPEETLKVLDKLIQRRVKREPLAYIRGKAWFYGRFFKVNPDVMTPRPESEAFIELLKQLSGSMDHEARSMQKIVDIGTGSGCLAITAALELPDAEVIAIDNSKRALEVAQKNAKKHKVDINFFHGDLLQPLYTLNADRYNLVLMANLPYVPDGLITSPEILKEPKEALFSGKDGLDHYRKFWEQTKKLPKKPRHILTESLVKQHQALAKLAHKAGYELRKTELLVQLFARV